MLASPEQGFRVPGAVSTGTHTPKGPQCETHGKLAQIKPTSLVSLGLATQPTALPSQTLTKKAGKQKSYLTTNPVTKRAQNHLKKIQWLHALGGWESLCAHVLTFQLSQAGTLNLNLFQTPKSREV